MTGLRFNSQTSIGVGNVMELQINFGMPGVAVGFFVLGWAIGKLDLKAAIAERQGEAGTRDYVLSSLRRHDSAQRFYR